jgi:hypothetical protein
MGVRIDVFLSHGLALPIDSDETLSRLNGCVGSALAVRDYWKSRGGGNDLDRWTVEPEHRRLPHLKHFQGPGALWMSVTPRAARIGTGARWRGFLSIDDLRSLHLAAFRSIAAAMGSRSLAICADDNDAVTDVFLVGGSQADCIAVLSESLGPPQASVESIASDVTAVVEKGSPRVWFLDGAPCSARNR